MLQALQLGCQRGSRHILEQVELTLQPGEVLVVLGTNGAGKSTLLATLTGELAPATGQVLLDQRPLASWSALERARRMAVLPQSSALAFAFQVEEVVAMGRMPHASGQRRDSQILREVMAAADVSHLAARSYLSLSGGERQRVHLARVLAQVWNSAEQGCLLLDEPTASLDLAHQHLTLQQARQMAARGLAVLVVLHDLNLAARYADRLLLLHEGRVSAQGTPWEVLQVELLEQVFKVPVSVQTHPLHACPLVLS